MEDIARHEFWQPMEEENAPWLKNGGYAYNPSSHMLRWRKGGEGPGKELGYHSTLDAAQAIAMRHAEDLAERAKAQPQTATGKMAGGRDDAYKWTGPTCGAMPGAAQPEPAKNPGELREALAAYAHHAWGGWMNYLFTESDTQEDGTVVIPKCAADRWKRQAATGYCALPDDEKPSDRNEADEILGIVAKCQPEPVREPYVVGDAGGLRGEIANALHARGHPHTLFAGELVVIVQNHIALEQGGGA